MKMNIKNILALLFFTLISSACADSPFTPKVEEQPPRGQTSVLGLMQVTIKGIGTQSMSAAIHSAGSRVAADLTTPSDGSGSHDGSIQYKSVSVGSFTYGDRAADGVRYIYAAFKVRNADASGTIYSTARQNLTFLAVDTDPSAAAGETYEHTAVSKLGRFNGDEPVNAKNIAQNIIPTGKVELNAAQELASSYPDVLQIFTEDEVQDFEDTLPTNTEVADIFPYGFIVRSPNVTPGSRELPSLVGDGRAVENQFDGVVTFAFKIPLQTVANQDPFEITMLFLAVDDNQTRITRSIEEALYGNNADFEARAMELNANMVTLLGNTAYTGSIPEHLLCNTRVAGLKTAPETRLISKAGCDLYLSLYYVDADANGTGNGSSWDNAYNDLKDALAGAELGDGIWVAEGTYYPDEGIGQTSDDRNSTFQLESGVEIYGGFDPDAGDDTFSERDWSSNLTVLSGDLTQNDGADFLNNSENAHHVVTGFVTDNTALLNGFRITGGNGHYGGGFYLQHGSPTLTNLTISGNTATNGGGIYAENSDVNLTNVTISGNTATNRGGGMINVAENGTHSPVLTDVTISGNIAYQGGGIFNKTRSSGTFSPVLTNVTISGNTATESGGGIFASESFNAVYVNVIITGNKAANEGGGIRYTSVGSPALTNVTIKENTADKGGGIYLGNSIPELTNVVIIDNSATSNGGGIYNEVSSIIMKNVTIGGNESAGSAGGIYSTGGFADIEMYNSVIWGNTGLSIENVSGSTSTISNSTVESGCPAAGATCTNVTSADPLFVDVANGDYTLQTTSPAIDAGDNSFLPLDIFDLDGDGSTTETIPSDLAGNARIVNGMVDQGAYEVQ